MNRILKINKPKRIKHWNNIAATFALMTFTTVAYPINLDKINSKTEWSLKSLSEGMIKYSNNVKSNDSIPKIIKGKVIEEDWDFPVQTKVF